MVKKPIPQMPVCACDVPGSSACRPGGGSGRSRIVIYKRRSGCHRATGGSDGWVTELHNAAERRQLDHAAGIDNFALHPRCRLFLF